MTQTQLTLLLEYISNEISLQAVRASGMTWQPQLDMRTELKTKLLASVVVEKPAKIEVACKPDSPVPLDGANKFSPLMIEMLLFVAYAGHRFSEFPNLRCRAQQEAYNWFVINGYFKMVDLMPSAALTVKGSLLVNKILNTTLD